MPKKLIISAFERDNFARRRSIGNEYDPESLITGAEIDAGLDYGDNRWYRSQAQYEAIISGQIPVSAIPTIAPRVRGHRAFA